MTISNDLLKEFSTKALFMNGWETKALRRQGTE
jgi:hypothetical protein